MTRTHEIITYLTHINTRALYIFSIPALLGFLMCGGLNRAFQGQSVRWWTALVIWMVLCVPFSIWKADSLETVAAVIRANYVLLLFLAGIPMVWKHSRLLLLTIGFSGIAHVVIAILFTEKTGDRLGTEFATLGNPTDLAAILVLLLPFMAYLVMYPPPMKIFWRVVGVVSMAYALYRIIASGSRGAVIAMAAALVIVLVKANSRQRIFTVAFLLAGAVIAIPVVPKATLGRLLSYSADRGSNQEEVESAWIRKRLFEEGISTTLSHPLFGVGPNQFGNFQGKQKEQHAGEAIVGWGNAHNSYLQISSDTGFPGFVFDIAAMVSMLVLIQKTGTKARLAGLSEQANASLYMLIGCVAFCIAIFFLNFAYLAFLPAMSGVSIAVANGVDQEIARRRLSAAAQQTVAAPRFSSNPAFSPQSSKPSVPASPAPVRNRFRFGRYR